MKYWNSRLKNMAEYMPGEQPENLETYIKLNTNENPFPPFPSVLEALKHSCNQNLCRYPNPTAYTLRETFAGMNNLSADNVFVGNGSDEIFTLIFRGFIDGDQTAAFPYPSYSLYYTLAESAGVAYDKLALDGKMDVNFNEYLKKKYRLVIVGNPNNPTGRGCDTAAIKAFLQKFKGLLVVDEAYVDFYGESALDMVREFDNLIVTRSFSKSYSLAGLRIGIAAACPGIIRGFIKLKDSYNIDRLAEAGAVAALKDQKSFRYNLRMIRDNKEFLEEKLESLGFTIVPSKANFMFVKHPGVASGELYRMLKERKILVRFFEGPVQSEYVRITVGTMMELRALVKELEAITAA